MYRSLQGVDVEVSTWVRCIGLYKGYVYRVLHGVGVGISTRGRCIGLYMG